MDSVSSFAQAYLDRLLLSPEWLLIIAVVGALELLAKPVRRLFQVGKWFRSRQAKPAMEAMQAALGVASFSDADVIGAQRHYIEPDASNVDPANEDDLRDFAFVREPAFGAIGRALETHDKVHMLVLADSGMGKTTFLLNMYGKEQRRAPRKRRAIAVVPLGRDDAVEQIKRVPEKRRTMLLLDAFDEDTNAIADHDKRLLELMEAAADFKSVIVTSRTQFFASDAALPTSTGIARVGPRRAGANAAHHFKRIYLLPFSASQVEAYVRATIPALRFVRRRRARALLARMPELSVRPMLLALLPELLERESDLRELWDLYLFMVDSWLTRESYWIEPAELATASKRAATEIFLGREARKSERLSPSDLANLLPAEASDPEKWRLTSRSLLNRDASGSYKFAHRSIMEFMFVQAFIDGDDRCKEVMWTDMMCTLFLSWGRSKSSATDVALRRAQVCLSGDGMAGTGLFPLETSRAAGSRIDSLWAKTSLSRSPLTRERGGLPLRWRKWTSRSLQKGDVVRIYDFSEGLAWQIVTTRGMDHPSVYRIGPFTAARRGRDGREWARPTLSEFRALVETMLSLGLQELSRSELYWLAEVDQDSFSVVKFRDPKEEPSATPTFPNSATLLESGTIGTDGSTLDVYRLPSFRHLASGEQGTAVPQALEVLTFHGDSQALWRDDQYVVGDDSSAWGLRSEDDGNDGPKTSFRR